MIKEKSKKSNLPFMLLVIFLMAAIACISSFGLATWARYRSTQGGNVIAQIAKWSFKVNGQSEEFAEIDLADTIYYDHVVDTTIAPGTRGSFDLEIDGTGSEVSLDYYINMLVSQKPTNMKFYIDNTFSTELEISSENKMFLDGELLLSEPMKETRTIYWDWAYRTNVLPAEPVLTYYLDKIDGLQALINEYNNSTTDIDKQNVAMKINDRIDTKEAGGRVLLQITVNGVQINPEFALKGVRVTSDVEGILKEGDVITVTTEFTESVYADASKTAITETSAPKVTVEFDGISTASNLVAKVASLVNTNLRVAEGENLATFVNVDANKINYSYVVKSGDRGNIRIGSIVGKVYNINGKELIFTAENTKVEIIGDGVEVEWINSENTFINNPEIKIGNEIITLTKENVNQYYGKEVTYSDKNNLRKYRLFYVDFDNKYKEGNGAVFLKADWKSCDVTLKNYVTHSSSDLKIMKQMNPKWNSADGVVNSANEKVVSWLLDKNQWESYANRENEVYGRYVKYAVGSPSLELYLDSYNQSFNADLQCFYGTYGYYFLDNDSGSIITNTGNNSINSGKQELYIGTGTNKHVYLASMSEPDVNCVYNINDYYNRLNGSDMLKFGPYGACPIIVLEPNATIQLK